MTEPKIRIECNPGIGSWWVSRITIPPDCITEIHPVGDDTKYNEIVEQVARESCSDAAARSSG